MSLADIAARQPQRDRRCKLGRQLTPEDQAFLERADIAPGIKSRAAATEYHVGRSTVERHVYRICGCYIP